MHGVPLCREQAQVLSDAAAHKKLGKVNHKRDVDVPVMFYGTLEIAWINKADVVPFAEGVQKGFLSKAKQKNFQKAVEQVRHEHSIGHLHGTWTCVMPASQT